MFREHGVIDEKGSRGTSRHYLVGRGVILRGRRDDEEVSVKMENDSSTLTPTLGLALSSSDVQYPTHDPTLAQILGYTSSNSSTPMHGVGSVAIQQDHPTTNSSSTPLSESGNTQIQLELTSIIIHNPGSDGQHTTSRSHNMQPVVMLHGTEENDTTNTLPTPTDMPKSTATGINVDEPPVNQNQLELTSPAPAIDHNASIMTGDEQHTSWVLGRVIQNLPVPTLNEIEEANPPSSPTPTEFEPSNNQNQPESTSPTMDIIVDHEPRRLNNYLGNIKPWVVLFITCFVPVVMWNLGKHKPLAGYCFMISIALIALASQCSLVST
ncbi:hypothetical protein QVD17_22269 [Tagetes erecta]|uniref:Uncharacterized protein n=1 Tax=Tagetes erecta TaxID=13708 RepID=A0AAD8KCT9_TARER|nr:hypothetical protein QVD17_22269 [Tagetes erecta]